MSSTLPTPVAAVIGVIPTAIDTARRVPGKVVQLPILAVSTALSKWAEAQQRYDELAQRGEHFLSSVRGGPDLSEMQVDEWLGEHLPTEDEAPDPVAQVTELLDRAASKKPQRHDTAATPEVVEVVEEVAAAIGGEEPSHSELPLPDYDHMTLGSLRGRIRSLTVEQLVAVRDYEKAHGDRLPVVTLVDNRIAKLALEGGEPSSGGALPVTPEAVGEGKVNAPKRTPAKRPTTKVRTT
ncbi:MAG: hypothetical protein JWO22_3617 [Frankiales bacterium]|nr:hypothetical protein [Frankiales bacterium]